jgi:hypothetical protein
MLDDIREQRDRWQQQAERVAASDALQVAINALTTYRSAANNRAQ